MRLSHLSAYVGGNKVLIFLLAGKAAPTQGDMTLCCSDSAGATVFKDKLLLLFYQKKKKKNQHVALALGILLF